MVMVPSAIHLEPDELRARAARIRLVLTDVDGTLTDGGVYYSARGEEMKRFDLRDGMGVERLRGYGMETAFVTRESSPIVQRRAEKLSVKLFSGLHDKRAALPGILRKAGITPEQAAYFGDDINDAGIMDAIWPEGLAGAPADAQPHVWDRIHFRSAQTGGHGAFREFAEWLIRHAQPEASS